MGKTYLISAFNSAAKDISDYIKNHNIEVMGSMDIWHVAPSTMQTKENRRLNRALGIKNVNYNGGKKRI